MEHKREFILSYQGAIKDEPLIRIAKMANLDGLAGRQIEAVETSVEFGVGMKVRFVYKQESANRS